MYFLRGDAERGQGRAMLTVAHTAAGDRPAVALDAVLPWCQGGLTAPGQVLPSIRGPPAPLPLTRLRHLCGFGCQIHRRRGKLCRNAGRHCDPDHPALGGRAACPHFAAAAVATGRTYELAIAREGAVGTGVPCAMRSLRPSPIGSAWNWQSAVRSSPALADGCGCRKMCRAAPSFSSRQHTERPHRDPVHAVATQC